MLSMVLSSSRRTVPAGNSHSKKHRDNFLIVYIEISYSLNEDLISARFSGAKDFAKRRARS